LPAGECQVALDATRTNTCASGPGAFTKEILIVVEGAPHGAATAGIAFWGGPSASRGQI
jgi:hypothetical protein